MNRFKEKLKAIWCIITSREYLILYSNSSFKCRIISNHNSIEFLESSKRRIDNKINVIKRIKHASEELCKVGFTSKDVVKAFGADKNIPKDY